MNHNIIPADGALADLQRKLEEYEAEAENANEPEATKARDMAELCREWISNLQIGRWTS